MAAPTDDVFLERLYRSYARHGWADKRAKAAGIMYDTDELISLGLATEEDRIELERVREEMSDPRRAFSGKYVSTVRSCALALLGDMAANVADIPVRLLPTWEVNACCVRTPRGNAVILLNSGLSDVLQVLYQSYLALDTYHESQPFCRDHPHGDFAKTIVDAAAYTATGDLEYMRVAPALFCPSVSVFNKIIAGETLFVEAFILLHEYGHLVKGHLRNRNVRTRQISSSFSVDVFAAATSQEFEADEFAFRHAVLGTRQKPTSVLSQVGILYCFFDLVEAFTRKRFGSEMKGSHPPGMERFGRLADLGRLASNSTEAAGRVKPWFGQLRKFADLYARLGLEGMRGASISLDFYNAPRKD